MHSKFMHGRQAAGLLVMMVAILLAACGGGGGGGGGGTTDEPLAPTTGGGPSVATRTAEIPPSDTCPFGGIQVDTGIDENGNGVLDSAEVDETQYVCNGSMEGLLLAADLYGGDLYAVDPATGALERLPQALWWNCDGPCNLDGIRSLAYYPATGTLYAGDWSAQLWRLDYGTAEGHLLSSTGIGSITGMAVRSDQTIFGITGGPGNLTLGTIDPLAGVIEESGTVDVTGGGNALTFDPTGTTLYLSNTAGLHVLDQTDGTVLSSLAHTFKSFPPLGANVPGPRFSSLTLGPAGRVYGILNDSGGEGGGPFYLAWLDLDTAEATNLGQLMDVEPGGFGGWQWIEPDMVALVFLPCRSFAGCNAAPIADAGPDQPAVGPNVTLDGTLTIDPDGDVFGYQWTLVSKPAGSTVTTASLNDPNAVNPVFAPDKTGDYVWRLVASDGLRDSLPDTVTVTATDLTAPTVLSTNPANGNTTTTVGMMLSTFDIRVTFSEDMNQTATGTPGVISASCTGGVFTLYTPVWESAVTVRFGTSFTGTLNAGDSCQINVSSGAQDLLGNGYAGPTTVSTWIAQP